MSYRTALDLLQVPATVHLLPFVVRLFTLACLVAALFVLATMRRK
jgi:hypothetical protein